MRVKKNAEVILSYDSNDTGGDGFGEGDDVGDSQGVYIPFLQSHRFYAIMMTRTRTRTRTRTTTTVTTTTTAMMIMMDEDDYDNVDDDDDADDDHNDDDDDDDDDVWLKQALF